ncbi:class I SAM-dependent methyltransferase [Candidatus Pacearchaeota archaeon]|nr:class I SAM-dependent methyltransferase [Candidatus Pacearchaeota archaeon]
MITREQFYTDYDRIVPTIFEPYNRFIEIAAKAIPNNVESVCDLGIGTGNLSAAIKKYLPRVKIIGVDKYESFAEKAKIKIPGLALHIRDIFDGGLPNADYLVSSLTTHHFDTQTRREKLKSIARSGLGFVNFDMMLCDDLDLEDTISLIVDFASRSYSDRETLEELGKSIRENDNPMTLDEQLELFDSIGMRVDVLAKENPFAVYHAYWPTRKL